MMHLTGPMRSGTYGLLWGSGSYAYLPFDCRVGKVAGHLVNIGGTGARASVQLLQNGTPISTVHTIEQGVPNPPWNPVADTVVLPGVTGANLDTTGKLSWLVSITGSGDPNSTPFVRLAVQLIPVLPAFADAQVLTLFATGEETHPPCLISVDPTIRGNGPFDYDWAFNEPAYAIGFYFYPNNYPLFNGRGQWSESGGDAVIPESGSGFHAGQATPMPCPGLFQDLLVVSSDAGGFDGDYTVSTRKNGNDGLVVAATAGATRIFTSGTNEVVMNLRDQFCFKGIQHSGVRLRGHILLTFIPDAARTYGAGYGAFGYGQRNA